MLNKKILATIFASAFIISSLSTMHAYNGHNNWYWNWNHINKTELTDEQKVSFESNRLIMQKIRTWEELTSDEETFLNENRFNRGWHHNWTWFWPIWKHMNFFTEDELEKFNSMTDLEKQNLIEEKRTEQINRQKQHETVINKLLNYEELTSDEELIRQEIIQARKARITIKESE